MKYALNIFFLFICLILIIKLDNSSNDGIPVMSSNDDNEYKIFDIYTNNLTTKNFDKYFSNTDNIVAVYPKVNALYKDKLGNIFFNCEKGFNIQDFISYYKKVLDKNNYKTDMISIDYYGLAIEKIKIYSNQEELLEILNNCSICTINR